MLESVLDVLPIGDDVFIPVRPLVLVIESRGVAELVDDDAQGLQKNIFTVYIYKKIMSLQEHKKYIYVNNEIVISLQERAAQQENSNLG